MEKNSRQSLLEQEAYAISKNNIKLLGQYCDENLESIGTEFLDAIENICIKIKQLQDSNQKKAISYIVISFPRINILNGSCKGRVDAYEASFYDDAKECYVDFDAEWLLKPLIGITAQLKAEKELYHNISEKDISSVLCNELENYYFVLIALVRYMGYQIESIEKLKEIEKNQLLEIRIGEYCDITYPAYSYLTEEVDVSKINLYIHKKSKHYYKPFRDINLSNENYSGINMFFCDFSKSNLASCNFSGSDLSGSIFRKSNLAQADFSDCILNGADFRGANLENVNFSNAKIFRTVW